MANAGPPAALAAVTGQFAFDLDWVLLAVALVALVVGGFVFVMRAKRWQAKVEPKTVAERLSEYQELVNQGLLQPDELERIRARLLGPAPEEPDRGKGIEN